MVEQSFLASRKASIGDYVMQGGIGYTDVFTGEVFSLSEMQSRFSDGGTCGVPNGFCHGVKTPAVAPSSIRKVSFLTLRKLHPKGETMATKVKDILPLLTDHMRSENAALQLVRLN